MLELLYLLEGIGYNHLATFACGMLFPYRIPYAIWSLSFACFGAYDMLTRIFEYEMSYMINPC